MYLSLFSDAKRQFTTYVDSGTVLNSKLSYLFPEIYTHSAPRRRLLQYFQLVSLRQLSVFRHNLSKYRLTRMRQMACHPDLVLRSKSNVGTFLPEDVGEATVCRLCNDIAEDAIQSKCHHIFDRECIKQYLNTALEQTVRSPQI